MESYCFNFKEKNEEVDEEVPYAFFINDLEINSTLEENLKTQNDENFEKITEIVYQAQALFR